MTLRDLGEFGAIEKIAGFSRPGGLLKTGIGDDAAVFEVGAGYEILASTDLLAEGIHFDLGYTGLDDLGYKALAANLSDIAAMGGEPLFYFVSIAAPGTMDFRDYRKIFAGMDEAASESGARLAGGDTCSTPGPVFMSVSIIGRVKKGRAVRRSGSKPGDGIWVTGFLGDSAAGLEILKSTLTPCPSPGGRGVKDDKFGYLMSRHLRPEARVKAGIKSGVASSMIDISDGLASDLRHVLKASGTGAVIYEDKLPLSRQLLEYAGEVRAAEFALSGGEDYELLFTVRPDAERRLAALEKKAGIPFTRVGEIIEGGKIYIESAGGKRKALKIKGYEHFE